MVEFARSVLATVAHVATPEPLRERTNWLVQLVPVYAVTVPLLLPKKSADGTLETVRLVVEARVALMAVVDAYGNCEAATVDEEKKTPWVKMEVVVAAVPVAKELRLVNG
jgi:hypothetical protein